MSRLKTEDQMTNFAEFKSTVKKYGFSINNFYDVIFEFRPGSRLYQQLVSSSEFSDKGGGAAANNITKLLTLYTDEASLPGLQISTGEYRINNSPQLKYAYGSVFSEASFSFIMDANSIIKNMFDAWTAWIYGYAIDNTFSFQFFGPPDTNITHRLRTRYRDDYAIDVIIVKYERASSSKENGGSGDDPRFNLRQIIPDSPRGGGSKFYKAVPVYAMKLFNAFPSNISSVPLNSGTSELSKLSVSLEYETYTTSALTGRRSVEGNVFDVVNSGDGATLDLSGLGIQIPTINFG